jgi:ankyrin repeat protein
LLKHGTDVQAKDYYGETELHLAAKLGHNAVVELIIKHRAECGETAPHHAAKNGYDVVVEMLITYGTDTKAKIDLGEWIIRKPRGDTQQRRKESVIFLE